MNSKKSLSKSILLALEKSVDGYVRLEDFIYNTHIYAGGYERPLKKSALSQALARVRKNGWVELINDQEIFLKLTDKGKEQSLLVRMESPEEKWDGKWRVVMFDIPEKRKVVRNLLRYKLKLWGFVPWQKSVWVSKKDCTQALRQLIKEIGINDWVKIMEAEEIQI